MSSSFVFFIGPIIVRRSLAFVDLSERIALKFPVRPALWLSAWQTWSAPLSPVNPLGPTLYLPLVTKMVWAAGVDGESDGLGEGGGRGLELGDV